MRRHLSLIAGSIVALALCACTGPEPTPTPTPTVAEPVPCASEDVDDPGPLPCFWNAAVRGNGAGQSYWIDVDGQVHPGLDTMPRPDHFVPGLDTVEE